MTWPHSTSHWAAPVACARGRTSRRVRTCVAPHVRPPPAGAHCSARCDDNHAPRLHQAAQNRRDDDLRPTQLARVRHGDEEREGHLGVLKTKGGVESTRSSYPVDSYKDRIPWLLTVFSCESALLLSEKKFMLLWKISSRPSKSEQEQRAESRRLLPWQFTTNLG